MSVLIDYNLVYLKDWPLMCLPKRSKITESSLTEVSLCIITDIVCIYIRRYREENVEYELWRQGLASFPNLASLSKQNSSQAAYSQQIQRTHLRIFSSFKNQKAS